MNMLKNIIYKTILIKQKSLNIKKWMRRYIQKVNKLIRKNFVVEDRELDKTFWKYKNK